jgi:hypothetical protein
MGLNVLHGDHIQMATFGETNLTGTAYIYLILKRGFASFYELEKQQISKLIQDDEKALLQSNSNMTTITSG